MNGACFYCLKGRCYKHLINNINKCDQKKKEKINLDSSDSESSSSNSFVENDDLSFLKNMPRGINRFINNNSPKIKNMHPIVLKRNDTTLNNLKKNNHVKIDKNNIIVELIEKNVNPDIVKQIMVLLEENL